MKYIIIKHGKLILFAVAIFLLCLLTVFISGVSKNVIAAKSKRLPIYAVNTPEKKIALSFDSSWGDSNVNSIIEILNKYNVKATFFVTGGWADMYPDSLKKLYANGHDIQNHSNKHPHMSKMTKEQIIDDINKCSDKIENLIAKRPNLFRAPFGEYTNSVIEACDSLKMHCVQWDVDTIDWKDKTANEIYTKVVTKTQNGTIILCHTEAKHIVEALPRFIEKLKKDGYEFVLINNLIYKENYSLDHEGRQNKLS